MLKLLACLFMLLDHIGYYFYPLLPEPVYLVLRSIGRLAFPIFAWSVARGYSRTHNLAHYFLRMAIFAVLTEILFRIIHPLAGVSFHGANVLVTFTLAIVLLAGYQLAAHSTLDLIASLRPIAPTPSTAPTTPHFDVRINLGGIELDRRVGLPLGLLMMLLAFAAAIWLKPDYDVYGLCTVWLFFAVHDHFPEKDQPKRALQGFILLNAVFLALRLLSGGLAADWASLQCLSVLAVPLCYVLNREQRPKPAAKYAFYLFYPLHILVLLLIRLLIWSS